MLIIKINLEPKEKRTCDFTIEGAFEDKDISITVFNTPH